MNTLLNYNATALLGQINSCKPVSVQGKAAVEQIKAYMRNNALTIVGIEQCILKLSESGAYDPAIANLKQTFENILSVEHRMVGRAYEALKVSRAGMIFNVGVEATNALAELYQNNAAKIIDSINAGVLNAWKFNPEIARLIQFADAASRDKRAKGLPSTQKTNVSDIDLSVVALLRVANMGDKDTVMYLDGQLFIEGARGSLTGINREVLSSGALPAESMNLIRCLDAMMTDIDHANILVFKPEIQSMITNLGVDTIAIDLLAPAGSNIKVGTRTMSFEKFADVFKADNDKLIAILTVDYKQAEVVRLVTECIRTILSYAENIVTNNYIYKMKMVGSAEVIYVGQSRKYFVMSTSNNIISSINAYDTVFSMLSNETLIAVTKAHTMVQELYADNLASEQSDISVRRKIAEDLTRERGDYEVLRRKIETDITTLNATPDVNPEKLSSLTDLLDKVQVNISKIDDEISKLDM